MQKWQLLDYFLHSHHLNQHVFPKVHHLSPHLLVLWGCCPYSESIQFGEILEFWQSLLLDNVLVMELNTKTILRSGVTGREQSPRLSLWGLSPPLMGFPINDISTAFATSLLL